MIKDPIESISRTLRRFGVLTYTYLEIGTTKTCYVKVRLLVGCEAKNIRQRINSGTILASKQLKMGLDEKVTRRD